MTIQENSNLFKILLQCKKDMDRGYDKFIGIFGDEGKGKSESLLLPIIDCWYNQILGKPVPEGCFTVDYTDFGKVLMRTELYDIAALDETSDALNAKDSMRRFNKTMYQTYTIIRGKRILTIVVMPSFFDLDSGFRKRRMAGAFHVTRRVGNICKKCSYEFVGDACVKCGSKSYKKGYIIFKYYTKDMLERICVLTRYSAVPKMNVVQGIEGMAHKYEGPLLDIYRPMKEKKMQSALENVQAELSLLSREDQSHLRRCPNCSSSDIRFSKGKYICRGCAMSREISQAEIERIKSLGGEVRC